MGNVENKPQPHWARQSPSRTLISARGTGCSFMNVNASNIPFGARLTGIVNTFNSLSDT